MESITISYVSDCGDIEGPNMSSSTTFSDDVLSLGDAVEKIANFLSQAYGYRITLEYDTHTDVSKQAEE